MKRILFVIGNLAVGGAQKSLVSLLNAIDFSKYEIDLLIFSDGGEFRNQVPNNVNFICKKDDFFMLFKGIKPLMKYCIKNRRYMFAIKRALLPVRWRLNEKYCHPEQIIWQEMKEYSEMLEGEYDIAVAYCQGLPTYYVADKVSAKKKIAWMHSDIARQKHDIEYSLKYYQKYDKIECVSEKAKDSFAQAFQQVRDRTEVFYNFVERKMLYELSMEESIDLTTEKKSLLTIGRLTEAKGYDNAVRAQAILKKRGCDVTWYVIGGGVDEGKIRRLIKEFDVEDSFILLGEKVNPYPYLKECDIYVQTSKWEGFGITVAEAKAFFKPIVTTNFSGADEQIINGKTGLVVGISPQEIADGIEKLVSDESLCREFSENLSDVAETDNVSEKFDALIENL